MRGTLIGSDYLKQGNEVKFLEINTNITINEYASEWLDTGSLMAVLTGSNITEFHFIHMGVESDWPPTETQYYKFAELISSSCAQHNITFTPHEVASGAITVPYIEDASHKFILRQAYDNTAIIDSTYAADEFEFSDLMSGSSYSPKIYYSSSIDDLYSDSLNNINISSSHPNIVIKSRYPGGDNPKIYKYTDTSSFDSDLASLKTGLADDLLIQEFINDDSNIVSNKWSIIRGVDILYGDNLESLHLGGYKVSSYIPLDFGTLGYSFNTQELNQQSTLKYQSKGLGTTQQFYHTDEETLILKSDGSLVSGSQLSVDDEIKSIVFDFEHGGELSGSLIVTTEEFINHYGYINDITGSIQYHTSSLITIDTASAGTALVEVEFTDGSTMFDSPRASYLIEESGSNLTYFEFVNKYIPGDKIIELDITTNQMVTKEVQSLSMAWGDYDENIYNLDFEPYDYFLSNISGSIYRVAHNACNYCGYPWAPCGSYWCDNGCGSCQTFQPPGAPGGKY